MTTPYTPDAFWAKVDRGLPHVCWEWLGTKNTAGYGHFSYRGQMCVAHRVAWFLTYGGTIAAPKDLLSDQFVLHSCDNKACCNPAHLSTGTYARNQKEAYARGLKTMPRGSEHASAKLTKAQASEIKKLHAGRRHGYAATALKYKVSAATIGFLVRGVTHKEPAVKEAA